MIIEFSITNFRSIKEKQTFSLVAETTKSKRDSNTFEVEGPGGIRLLKSAVVCGSNASGKSNFIRAFGNFRTLIVNSGKFEAKEPIAMYDPFLFDIQTLQAATEYECTFIANDNVKYEYKISFTGFHVVNEELNYFPKLVKKNLFRREAGPDNSLSDMAKFNISAFKDEQNLNLPKTLNIFKNQAILSKFGRDIPNNHLTPIYLYFSKWYVWDTSDSLNNDRLRRRIIDIVIPGKGKKFFERLERLVNATDTKVNGLILKETQKDESAPKGTETSKRTTNRLFGKHDVYDKDKAISLHELPFTQESAGTKLLLSLGTLILDAIESGGVVIFDELDNSLHPKVSRFLVQLFNNKKYNTKNAQIVFSSHEANLMDKDIFRSDQLWFAQKDEKGATEIYSAQDFEGVREDIPFDKWYLGGKFGAIPITKAIDYVFKDA